MNKESFDNLSESRKKMEMMSFCNKNKIFIYLTPITNTQGRIDVKNKQGNIIEGKTIFNIGKKIKPKQEKWWIAIEKGYKYYYNQLKSKED
tara:strand:- start:367 stop:639 length:273 start_codon:yes stop_codon:yes gene_type:complete